MGMNWPQENLEADFRTSEEQSSQMASQQEAIGAKAV